MSHRAPLAAALAAVSAVCSAAAMPARAAERATADVRTPDRREGADATTDVETDHIDAFDDGGPRSFGLLLDPAALAFGTFAAEGDLVLGDTGAMSFGGAWTGLGGPSAYGAAVGFPVFPWRLMFHGFYVHPRAEWVHATTAGGAGDVLGAGATLGWQWTFRFGLTLRAGAGAAYDWTVSSGASNLAIAGLRPLLDGDVGWVF
jgi:hypothetical protein